MYDRLYQLGYEHGRRDALAEVLFANALAPTTLVTLEQLNTIDRSLCHCMVRFIRHF
jgi:hypothetical protein